MEEGGGAVFDKETLKILVDAFSGLFVEFFAAVLKKLVDFGVLVAGDVGGLG